MEDRPQPASEGYATIVLKTLQGPVYEDDTCWLELLRLRVPVQEWLTKVGLHLSVHESDGFAHITQPPTEESDDGLPRLMRKVHLGFEASLLCIMLRQALDEFDARSTSTKLFITGAEMKEQLSVFLKESSNRSKLLSKLNEPIEKLREIGILKPAREDDHNSDNTRYEVKRIIKALVSIEQLEDFKKKLSPYGESVHE